MTGTNALAYCIIEGVTKKKKVSWYQAKNWMKWFFWAKVTNKARTFVIGKIFLSSPMFAAEFGSGAIEGKASKLAAYIRSFCNWLTATNALAYCIIEGVTKKKKVLWHRQKNWMKWYFLSKSNK